ncbi:hypothetical protein AX14_013168 [Amanita brunnescens Koide BX004]|nr:hypothetical protein AX14_013168 [Amanita brunnescens Koide BX004]
MTVNPDKKKKPFKISWPTLGTEYMPQTEQYYYPLTNHPTPLPKRWLVDDDMDEVVHKIDFFTKENKNDVIHIPADGHIEWFELNSEGGIS